METLATILPCALCSLFLIPSLSILASLADYFSRSFMLVLWKHFGRHSIMLYSAAELPPPTGGNVAADCLKWAFEGERRGVRKYSPGVAHTDQAVQCVFCLCNVEEGEEIRELACEHLFHRSCLDRWVASGRMTCPLCRNSLVAKTSEAELPFDAEDQKEGLGQSVLMFTAYLHCEWWRR